jgi:hypothetical protein
MTSPTSGGRSVGIVRLLTKATEFFIICIGLNGEIRVGGHVETTSVVGENLLWRNVQNNDIENMQNTISVATGICSPIHSF